MAATDADGRVLDVVSVGESLVDFISREFRISPRTAERFERYLGGHPANVAVMTRSGVVAVSDGSSVERIGPLPRVRVEPMIDNEALYKRLETPAEQRA